MLVHVVTIDDVGKTSMDDWMFDPLGTVLEKDVGKRIYRVKNSAGDGFLFQVENEDQRAARLMKLEHEDTEDES